MRFALLLALLTLPTLAALAADPILIAPKSPTHNRHSEGSALELTPGGRILATWTRFNKSGSDDGPATLVASHSDDAGKTWSAPRELPVGAGKVNVMQSGLLAEGGRVLCFFSVRDSRVQAGKFLIESTDAGQTWSDRRRVTPEDQGYVTGANDRAVRLRSGRILLPCHMRVGPDDLNVRVARSDDKGKTWTLGPALPYQTVANRAKPYRTLEAGVAELSKDNHLLMILRSSTGRLFTSRSQDAGDTWTAPVMTSIPALEAPPLLKRLTDGRLMLLWNPPADFDLKLPLSLAPPAGELPPAKGNRPFMKPRTRLALSLSADDGQTWSPPQIIASDPKAGVTYPAALPLADNKRLLVFYSRAASGIIADASWEVVTVDLPPN
ncbi:MAG TPA: sialidase family protein [Tepidisphaeraceae bacterium]|nr:sialidase family protein [Tepidisphaeraceae bacterium]